MAESRPQVLDGNRVGSFDGQGEPPKNSSKLSFRGRVLRLFGVGATISTAAGCAVPIESSQPVDTSVPTSVVAPVSTDSPMAQATASGIPPEAYGFTLTPSKEVAGIGGEFPAEVLNSPVFQDRFNEANKLAQALADKGFTGKGKLLVPDMYAAQVDGVVGGVIASYLLISDQGELIQGTTPREVYFLSGSGEDQKLLKLVIPESREAGALLTDENARNFYTSFDPRNMEAKMVLVLGEGDKPAELRVMIFEYQTDQTVVLGYFDNEGVFQRVDSFAYQPPEGYGGANMDGIMTVTGGQLYGREVLYGAPLATEVELPGLPPSAIGTIEPEAAIPPTVPVIPTEMVQPTSTTGPTPPPTETPVPPATETSIPTVTVEPTGTSVPEATQVAPTGVPEETREPEPSGVLVEKVGTIAEGISFSESVEFSSPNGKLSILLSKAFTEDFNIQGLKVPPEVVDELYRRTITRMREIQSSTTGSSLGTDVFRLAGHKYYPDVGLQNTTLIQGEIKRIELRVVTESEFVSVQEKVEKSGHAGVADYYLAGELAKQRNELRALLEIDDGVLIVILRGYPLDSQEMLGRLIIKNTVAMGYVVLVGDVAAGNSRTVTLESTDVYRLFGCDESSNYCGDGSTGVLEVAR